MSAPGSTSHRPRALPAYVAAVILGIIGMHALVQHCPTSHPAMYRASTAEAAHHAGEHVAASAASVTTSGARVLLADHPSGGAGEMLMLCAAMLLGAGAVLLLLRRRPAERPLTVLRPATRRWRPPALVAGTGPPTALAFTVIRC